ncbi:MAG TPA: exonuclease [Phycisphaerae bacterium]
MLTELYFSTDVETDGPIPGPNSMLSFASACYTADKQLLGTFSANLFPLPGAAPDLKTLAWWQSQGPAWDAVQKDRQDPASALPAYSAWMKSLCSQHKARPVFVAYPVLFDAMFVYWYLIKFTGESPFSHSALDIKTMAMTVLKTTYRDSTKKQMPREWFDDLPHTHVALDDAIEQGALFCNILRVVRGPSSNP